MQMLCSTSARRAMLLCAAVATLARPGGAEPPPTGPDAKGSIGAESTPAPDDVARSAAGLIRDVERIVSAEEASGWFSDDDAYDGVQKAMMQSVCRATPEARVEARRMLETSARRLGNPRQLFTQAGRELDDATADALTAERRLRALELTVENAHRCPFWVDSDPTFEGRQTDRNRFTLSLETGGMLQLRRHAGRWTYGGGGAGRLLGAYGFGGDFTLLAGPEFGGGAMLEPGGDGGTSQFVINYFPAIPVVLRWHDVAWHWDVELAPVSWFQASNTEPSFGGRLGMSAGVAALRTRGVIPWAGAAVAYEHYRPGGGREAAHFLRGGLRVGVIWDAQ